MEDLTLLGLTKNEIKVFEALIKHGKQGASSISKYSQVSYSRIYDVLDSLENKGLVKVIPEKSKKFVASNPDELKIIIENKIEQLNNLNKEIDKMKEYYDISKKDVVQIVQGKRNFYKLVKFMEPAKNYEYNIKYTGEYHLEWVRNCKKLLKNGVDIRELVNINKETMPNIQKWLKVHKNIKEIPNKGVAISIRDDNEILISLIKSNTQILIKDKSFIILMKELFKNYYDNHNEINIK